MDPSIHSQRARRRTRIGFLLVNSLWDVYVRELWEGANAAAAAADADLLTFVGNKILGEQATVSLSQNASLFSQVHPATLDGLVVIGLSDRVFLEHVPALGAKPTVSIQPSPEYPSVFADNYSGMRTAVEHLIDVHGRRRIAFIRGRPGDPGGDERYRGYLEVLRERGLTPDPGLAYEGDYGEASGERAVQAFLDQRRVAFDAVAAANDRMALAAMAALASRGVVVPGQVSVVGFDDACGASFSDPPLTTIRQPLREMGMRAVEQALAAVRGDAPPRKLVLPAELIVRGSCGCVSEVVRHAGAVTEAPRRRGRSRSRSDGALARARAEIVAAAEAQLVDPVEGLEAGWPGPLVDGMIEDLEGGSSRAFLDAVSGLAEGLASRKVPVVQAHAPLSVVRAAFLPRLSGDGAQLPRAELLWHQARILLHEAGGRQAARAAAAAEHWTFALQELIRSLSGAHRLQDVADRLARGLSGVGIRTAYLAVIELGTEGRRSSRLVMACRDGQVLALPPGGVGMQTRDILPPGVEPDDSRPRSLLVVPVFLDFDTDEQLGFAVFDATPENALTCQALADQLAGPLKGALVLDVMAQSAADRQDAEERLANELRVFLEVVEAVAGGDLTRRGAATHATLVRISSAVNDMLRRFSEILAEVRGVARQVSLSSAEILTSAGDIARGAEHTSDEVHARTSSVEEMAASMDAVREKADASAALADQVLDHVRRGDGSVEAAHAAMNRIDVAVQGTAEKMRFLGRRTAEISEVMGVIESIARRSKLLALNASIAAAQAGEAGRGFAVVADEVRRLAESSSAAVKEVGKRIEAVLRDTEPTVAAMENAMREVAAGREVSEQLRASLREISSLVQGSAQLSVQIAGASRQQVQTTRQVAHAMQAVSSDSSSSSSSAHEASAAVRGLVSLAEQLERAVSRFTIEEPRGVTPPAALTVVHPRG